MKKVIILVVGVALLVVAVVLINNSNQQEVLPETTITSFEECVSAGYPVLESFPEQCVTPEGETFFRNISEFGELGVAESCEVFGGNWLAEYSECEYISEQWCLENNGVFSECESACRHDEEAEMCTMECVPVCVIM